MVPRSWLNTKIISLYVHLLSTKLTKLHVKPIKKMLLGLIKFFQKKEQKRKGYLKPSLWANGGGRPSSF